MSPILAVRPEAAVKKIAQMVVVVAPFSAFRQPIANSGEFTKNMGYFAGR
jgi:hypothetical protein